MTPNVLFTPVSLIKDIWDFCRQNSQELLLIVSVPMLIDVSSAYVQPAFNLPASHAVQVFETLTLTIPSLSSAVIYLINMYLLGAVYHSVQRLFFAQELPIFPDFLKGYGVRQSALCLIATYNLFMLFLMIAMVPVYLSWLVRNAYPDQFWATGLLFLTGIGSLVLGCFAVGYGVRVMFAMPARCLNMTTRLQDILKLANQIGKGHVRTLIVLIIQFSILTGLIPILLASLLPDTSFLFIGLISAMSWLYNVVMILVYAVAFQAIYKHQSETNEDATS